MVVSENDSWRAALAEQLRGQMVPLDQSGRPAQNENGVSMFQRSTHDQQLRDTPREDPADDEGDGHGQAPQSPSGQMTDPSRHYRSDRGRVLA